MIGALNGTGTSSIAAAYATQATAGTGAAGVADDLNGLGQSTAAISGPGQLLSDLQQLQTQDPTKFAQVASQIAGQLQAASQQTQGAESTALSSLAAKFRDVASGGSLSHLQPQHHHHGHGHVQQAYGQGADASSGVAALAQSGDGSSTANSDLQQLFGTISGEVTSALAK